MPLDKHQYDLLLDCISIYENQSDKLNDFERGFFDKGFNGGKNLLERHEEYGENLNMSDKQIAVLQGIYDKVILGKDKFKR